MSADNEEIVRRLAEAYARRDLDAITPLLTEDVELVEWPNSPDSKTFRGHASAGRAMREWDEVWDDLESDVREVRDLGDGHVLAVARTRARGKSSSVEVEADTWAIYTLRDDKVAKIEFFIEEDQAMAAIGGEQPATTTREEEQ